MSEESDLEVFNRVIRKRSARRIEDSGSSSDSPFEQRRAHKRVLVSDISRLSALWFSSQFLISHLQLKRLKYAKPDFSFFFCIKDMQEVRV
jgi:hypothetical protein